MIVARLEAKESRTWQYVDEKVVCRGVGRPRPSALQFEESLTAQGSVSKYVKQAKCKHVGRTGKNRL